MQLSFCSNGYLVNGDKRPTTRGWSILKIRAFLGPDRVVFKTYAMFKKRIYITGLKEYFDLREFCEVTGNKTRTTCQPQETPRAMDQRVLGQISKG